MASTDITLRVRAVTDEMVERAARAGYEEEARAGGYRGGWDALSEEEKQAERDHARIMLVAAVLPARGVETWTNAYSPDGTMRRVQ